MFILLRVILDSKAQSERAVRRYTNKLRHFYSAQIFFFMPKCLYLSAPSHPFSFQIMAFMIQPGKKTFAFYESESHSGSWPHFTGISHKYYYCPEGTSFVFPVWISHFCPFAKPTSQTNESAIKIAKLSKAKAHC